jgi:hypothetical protein
MMTWIFGLAHEQACAILDIAIGPARFVGSKIESCTGPAVSDWKGLRIVQR